MTTCWYTHPLSSNMLYPKENKVEMALMYQCRTCSYTEPATSYCVYRNQLASSAGETAGVTTDVGSDPTLPRSNKQCPACSETECVFFQSQMRKEETKMVCSSVITLLLVYILPGQKYLDTWYRTRCFLSWYLWPGKILWYLVETDLMELEIVLCLLLLWSHLWVVYPNQRWFVVETEAKRSGALDQLWCLHTRPGVGSGLCSLIWSTIGDYFYFRFQAWGGEDVKFVLIWGEKIKHSMGVTVSYFIGMGLALFLYCFSFSFCLVWLTLFLT